VAKNNKNKKKMKFILSILVPFLVLGTVLFLVWLFRPEQKQERIYVPQELPKVEYKLPALPDKPRGKG